MRVLATYNIKGGVGKTATAINLAHRAAAAGARTLLWDLDPQGAATYCFRIKAKVKGGGKKLIRGARPLERRIRGTDFEGLDLLPADFSYRHLDLILGQTKRATKRFLSRIRPLAERYDYLFLDCAPSISTVSEAVFAAADSLLVPSVPTALSLRTLKQLANHLEREKVEVRTLPFFCMVDRRKALPRQICAETDATPFRFLSTSIPYSSIVEQMSVRRAPLSTFAAASAAARAYANLWTEIVSETGGALP